MADRSFDHLPLGWGALSMVPKRRRLRRSRWWPLYLLTAALATLVVLVVHWMLAR